MAKNRKRLLDVSLAVSLWATAVICWPQGRLVAADAPAAGKQVEQKLALGKDNQPDCGYQLFLPEGYGQADKQWPMILFLHGRGESYGPLSLVKKWGPPKICDQDPKYPYIVVSPQCPGKESWSRERQQDILVKLLDHIVSTYRVDPARIYLTGLSMGGYGSWRLAADHPHRFAAVVPVCGGGNPQDADKLKTLPIWVFHGDQDRAVPFERSVQMVDAIRKAGGTTIRFTSYEGFGHNCWTATYATPDMYKWLNRQKRASSPSAADKR